MQNAALFLTTFALLPPAVLKVFGSQPRHVWRFVINIVHYGRNIAEDLHGGGPVSQDNRGGLSAGRADAAEHLVLGWKFKNGTSPLLECVPPRSRWVLKCARRALLRQLSRPAAVLVTGIPGRRGSDVTTDPPIGDGGVAMTTKRSTGRKPAGTFGVLLGGQADIWIGGQVEVNGLFVVAVRVQISPPLPGQFAESEGGVSWGVCTAPFPNIQAYHKCI